MARTLRFFTAPSPFSHSLNNRGRSVAGEQLLVEVRGGGVVGVQRRRVAAQIDLLRGVGRHHLRELLRGERRQREYSRSAVAALFAG